MPSLQEEIQCALPKEYGLRRLQDLNPVPCLIMQASGRKKNLDIAKKRKNDEFYTQFDDIANELKHYRNQLGGKVVLCNCDNPRESNFFKYFVSNFNAFGLKKLIASEYKKQSSSGQVIIINEVKKQDTTCPDVDRLLENNKNIAIPIKGDGDFRSQECVEFLKWSDVVITNPPFSLFQEYVAQLIEYKKKFLIIGSLQAITYVKIFPLIKAKKLWMGVTIHSGDIEFRIPDHYPINLARCRIDENGAKHVRFACVRWWTNLEHDRRPPKLLLMTTAENLKFSKHKEIRGKASYEHYDNYNAIEVPFTDAIPSDYDEAMGVPITFLDKYNPDQFEILGATVSEGNTSGLRICKPIHATINGRQVFKRLFIKKAKT